VNVVAFRLSHARLANQLLVGCEHANVAAATAREMSAASRQTRYALTGVSRLIFGQ